MLGPTSSAASAANSPRAFPLLLYAGPTHFCNTVLRVAWQIVRLRSTFISQAPFRGALGWDEREIEDIKTPEFAKNMNAR